jgi:5-methylcytosine-specific restriction enzyme A
MAKIPVLRSRVATLGQVQRIPTKQKTAARGYGAAWQRARLRFLREHPLCVRCDRDGIVRAAGIVDHVTPHRGDQTLFWDETNWQSLCKWHHDSEKQRQERAEMAGALFIHPRKETT